jgi:putative hydrolase of the HAD superfamily
MGLEGFGERCWAAFIRGARANIFDRVLDEIAAPSSRDVVMRLRDVYRKHRPSIQMASDAARFLDSADPSLTMAAITDGPIESQRAKVAALRLDRWLEPIVLTEELGEAYRKPSPLAFEELQSRLRVRSNQCVYVADNPDKDFTGPFSLGWATCRIRRTDGLHEDAPSGEDVQFEIADLTSLPVHLTARS